MQKGSGGAAFTLIELLVVILILGILTAIFAPVLGRAREAGRRAQCINNLRQHGIAWYLYLDDHNECFPAFTLEDNDWSYGGKQGSLNRGMDIFKAENLVLNRYLDILSDSSPNVCLFHCPDDLYSDGGFSWLGNSYPANSAVLSFSDIRPIIYFKPRPLSTITSPRDRVYLEHDWIYNKPGHGWRGYVKHKTPVMVLFVDGHVGGPFLYDDDFEPWDPNIGKKVLIDPNGTKKEYD